LRSRCDAEVRAAEKSQAAELEKTFAARAREPAAALARLSKEEEAALTTEKRALEVRKKSIADAHAPALRAATDRQARFRQGIAGVAGIAKIELPSAALLFLTLWLKFQSAPLSALVALMGSLLAGWIVRSLVASIPVARAQRAYRLATEVCCKESESKSGEIRQRFTQARREPQAVLDAAAQEKSQIEDGNRKKIAAIRQQWETRIAKAAAEHEQRLRPFKSQLTREGSVKRESQKTEFPAYAAALRKGYKEGAEPSHYEMQMTADEEAQARLMLMGY
jgi:hypothetical protein